METLIVNPIAGHGYAKKVAPRIIDTLRSHYGEIDVKYTNAPHHATLLAREAVAAGSRTIVTLGGDGTIIETVRGVIGSDSAIAPIPAGTGNDFVKSLGCAPNCFDALTNTLKAKPRQVDIGTINDNIFANECGTGFDVEVLRYALTSKKYLRGLPAYLYGVIRAVASYKPIELAITREDGMTETRKVMVFAVANGGYIGGGICIAPTALIVDGLLDVVIIDELPKREIVASLPKLLTGNILKIRGAETFRCKSIEAVCPNCEMQFNIDGEIIPMSSVKIGIMKDALWVLA